ncbi:MAG: FAD-binding oxidoreductase [Rhizobiales bacterium]|nr:FAD-binding oxidoreductase [Hyphomicrobiales bacterium]NRB14566.1 FAD-binding oxidoreductase [Hyphomicrobiales bacterium]
MTKKIAIIGAGLIGTSIALRLAQKGLNVDLIDRSFSQQPASGGNAGIIAYSDIFPMISAKTLLKIPLWLADPKAMITLRPAYAFKMLPWFFQLIKSTQPSRKKGAIEARLGLMKTALNDHYEQIDKADIARFIAETGTYYLYQKEASFNFDASNRKLKADYGYEPEIVSASDAYKRINGLEQGVYKAVFEKDSAVLKSPMGLLQYLRDKARGLGVNFVEAEILAVERHVDDIKLKTKHGDDITADEIVIAAGAFSRKMTKDLGFDVPLDTERGYNVTIPNPPFEFDCAVIAKDAQIAVSSLTEGLRVGGGVEFAGIDAKPNYKRIDMMLKLAKQLFPSIPDDRGVRWMGCRPSMADDMPVIGRHPRDRRVYFAFGHAHLGMTMSAVTAKHICNLIVDGKTDVDLTRFRVDRF